MSKNVAYFNPAGTAEWAGESPTRLQGVDAVDRGPSYEDWDQVVAEVKAMQVHMQEGGSAGQFWTATNDNAGTLAPGCPVYLKSDGDFDKADADSTLAISNAIGLVTASALTTTEAQAQIEGILELTTAQWDTITGGSGGLTIGALYYVSATVGTLTATAPSTMGHFVKAVGQALSTTKMRILKSLPVIVP